MHLFPNATAILVADRRRALEGAATRRRWLAALRRRVTPTAPPAATPLPAPADRAEAEAAARAA